MKAKKFPWKCPNCSATADKCGDPDKAQDGHRDSCMGLICECEGDTKKGHGDTVRDPCRYANCYHCGWGGTMPNVQVEDPVKLLDEVLKVWAAEKVVPQPLIKRIEERVKLG